jgi:hypothetical protein
MSIVHISDDIKKEFRITSEGQSSITIRGAARALGISDAALRSNLKFKGANFSPSKMAEMLIDKGFNGANFSKYSQVGIPDLAFAVIVEYYAFYAEENCTEQAKAVLSSFVAIGI